MWQSGRDKIYSATTGGRRISYFENELKIRNLSPYSMQRKFFKKKSNIYKALKKNLGKKIRSYIWNKSKHTNDVNR